MEILTLLLAQAYNPDPTGELMRDKFGGLRSGAMLIFLACVVAIIVWFVIKAARKLDPPKPQVPRPVRDARRGFPMDPIPPDWGHHPDADVDEAMKNSKK